MTLGAVSNAASGLLLAIAVALAPAMPANAQPPVNVPAPTLPPGFEPVPLPLGKPGVGSPTTPPPPPPAGDIMTLEPNVDRRGGDYRNFVIAANQANPKVCQAACLSEAQCVAFTYVLPGVQGPDAMCWLKNQAAPPVAQNCCVSGIRMRKP